MGSEANRLRKKWQDYGGLKATKAEHDFYSVFVDLFKDTEYELIKQPNKFEDLYVNVKLSETENKEIYHPESPISKHGIKPDCWIVFQGDITRDPCRVREIRFWFDGNETNVFFWRNTKDSKALTTHFVNNILPLLE